MEAPVQVGVLSDFVAVAAWSLIILASTTTLSEKKINNLNGFS